MVFVGYDIGFVRCCELFAEYSKVVGKIWLE